MAKKPEEMTIIEALIAAQKVIPEVKMGGFNPHFKSKYPRLSDCMDACRGPLLEQGIMITHDSDYADGVLSITTILTHTSGETLDACLPMPIGEVPPQKVLAATSYGRRGSLMLVAGLVADDDNDGAEVSEAKPKPKPKPEKKADPVDTMPPSKVADPPANPPRENPFVTDDQRKELLAAAINMQDGDKKAAVRMLRNRLTDQGLKSSEQIKRADFNDWMDWVAGVAPAEPQAEEQQQLEPGEDRDEEPAKVGAAEKGRMLKVVKKRLGKPLNEDPEKVAILLNYGLGMFECLMRDEMTIAQVEPFVKIYKDMTPDEMVEILDSNNAKAQDEQRTDEFFDRMNPKGADA